MNQEPIKKLLGDFYVQHEELLNTLLYGIKADVDPLVAAYEGRLIIKRMPDGREIYCLDGKPFLEAYPMKVAIIENKITINQKYRILRVESSESID